MGRYSVEKLKFYRLLSAVGISARDVTYFYIYNDSLFFDYIAKVQDSFINFCLLTEANISRYYIIKKFDTWIRENSIACFDPPTIQLIKINNQVWFYEKMHYYPDLGKLSYNDCIEFDNEIQRFNKHISSFKKLLSKEEKEEYNRVIFEYTPSNMRGEVGDILFEYGDSFRCFDCNRVTKKNDKFIFTGYQGLLFYNQQINIGIILIMSMLNDTYKEKENKIALLSKEEIKSLGDILIIIEQRILNYPDQFYTSSEDFIKNLEDIKGIVCKQLQLLDQLDSLVNT